MSNLDLLPSRPGGGTRFGWSFLKSFKACETKWFNTYARPHPDGGTGCESQHTSVPLLLGSAIHKGLEAWRLSGWKDGNYDLSAAIEAASQELNTRVEEMLEGEEQCGKLTDQAVDLLLRYHAHWGPGGTEPEHPTWKVAVDGEGAPLVEREFELDLGYGGYTFTSKLDVVMEFQDYLVPLEIKTTAASRAGRLVQQFQLDGQATGQLWLLRQTYRDRDVGGLHLDMIIKGAAKDKSPFRREAVFRQDLDYETFHRSTVRTLQRIDEKLEEWRTLRGRGMSSDEAARQVFDAYPDGFQCVGNFTCPYFGACAAKGHEESWFRSHTRQRSPDDTIKGVEHER